MEDRAVLETDPTHTLRAVFDHIGANSMKVQRRKVNHKNSYRNTQGIRLEDPRTGKVDRQAFRPVSNSKFVSSSSVAKYSVH